MVFTIIFVQFYYLGQEDLQHFSFVLDQSLPITLMRNRDRHLLSSRPVYVKYKKAILSHIGCSFRTSKD